MKKYLLTALLLLSQQPPKPLPFGSNATKQFYEVAVSSYPALDCDRDGREVAAFSTRHWPVYERTNAVDIALRGDRKGRLL